MKFIDNKKILKKLKSEYNEEQKMGIIECYYLYPDSLNYMEPSLTIEDINEIKNFLSAKNTSLISDTFNLPFDKRLLIVKAFNKFNKLENKPYSTWKLVWDVASKYDDVILNDVIDKLVCESPDYNFLNLVKTAMQEDVDLRDLKIFNDEQSAYKRIK